MKRDKAYITIKKIFPRFFFTTCQKCECEYKKEEMFRVVLREYGEKNIYDLCSNCCKSESEITDAWNNCNGDADSFKRWIHDISFNKIPPGQSYVNSISGPPDEKRFPENPNEIIQYEHNGKMMSVIKGLKDKHKKSSLCWRNCKYFLPNEPEKNCDRAQKLLEFDEENGVTTPVWECDKYDAKQNV